MPFEFSPDDEIYRDPPVTLAAVEQACIEQVMAETAGDKFVAAHMLGMNLSTLYRKLKRYRVTAAHQANRGQ